MVTGARFLQSLDWLVVLEHLHRGDILGGDIIGRDAVASLQGVQSLDVELIDGLALVLDEPL